MDEWDIAERRASKPCLTQIRRARLRRAEEKNRIPSARLNKAFPSGLKVAVSDLWRNSYLL